MRDDREEEREDIPLLGEDMPVKRHVLFFLADGVSGDRDAVLPLREDVGELGDGIESFGDDVSGDEEAIQDEREGISVEREERKVEREILPVEREVLCDFLDGVGVRREVREEEWDARPESGEDVSVERDVLWEGRDTRFDERAVVAERVHGKKEA